MQIFVRKFTVNRCATLIFEVRLATFRKAAALAPFRPSFLHIPLDLCIYIFLRFMFVYIPLDLCIYIFLYISSYRIIRVPNESASIPLNKTDSTEYTAIGKVTHWTQIKIFKRKKFFWFLFDKKK